MRRPPHRRVCAQSTVGRVALGALRVCSNGVTNAGECTAEPHVSGRGASCWRGWRRWRELCAVDRLPAVSFRCCDPLPLRFCAAHGARACMCALVPSCYSGPRIWDSEGDVTLAEGCVTAGCARTRHRTAPCCATPSPCLWALPLLPLHQLTRLASNLALMWLQCCCGCGRRRGRRWCGHGPGHFDAVPAPVLAV